jgi:hypothetical protein
MAKRAAKPQGERKVASYDDFMPALDSGKDIKVISYKQVAPDVAVPRVYDTQSGYRLQIIPIPIHRIEKVRLEYKPLQVPTYQQDPKTVLPGDKPQIFPLDENSLDVEDNPEETAQRHQIWNEYTQENNVVQSKFGLKFIDLILMRGIKIEHTEETQAAFDRWLEVAKEEADDFDEEFPTSVNKIKALFLKDVALQNWEIPMVQALVLEASGETVDQSEVQAAIDSFRP